MNHVKDKFNAVEDYPYYGLMKKMGTKIIGVWDDHDYAGGNDGGMEFLLKHRVREIFLDFIEEPQDSARRLDKNSTIH